jgi:galactofuranosylgalactofuranosylrhamnosyl-N-acetylglucosaminyl-diphospho-decaprenol beta-1,5/1,6-galactofuranosyltransferase
MFGGPHVRTMPRKADARMTTLQPDTPPPGRRTPARRSSRPTPPAPSATAIGQGQRTAPADLLTLQNVIFPEDGICSETELYFHLTGPAGYSHSRREVILQSGGKAVFDSYFNAFSLSKWIDACHIDGLFLALAGRGFVEVKVWQAIRDRSWELLASEFLTLSAEESILDLSHHADTLAANVVFFEIRAFTQGDLACLTSARFATRPTAATPPELAVCITTFRREAQVERTAHRLEQFLSSFAYGDHVRVLVIDNGASAAIPATPHVETVANRNLGGAGGFSRGFIEAEARGATHCLFMDDDASFHLENLHRTYMFLMLARTPAIALAGAMINNTHKWAMWENGAVFDGRCTPQFCGVDLRDRSEVLDMEFRSVGEHRSNFYGGWWYFAFAIPHVTRRPFPFFVRGDDISFSMANRFRIFTLNGVTSFQDDFTQKESPLTLYLDLRSHLVHHLVFEQIDRGGLGTGWVAVRFILRSLARFHYETAEAQFVAWDDVMRGPAFFAENADMAERRKTIAGLVRNETWKPVARLDMTERRVWRKIPGRWWQKPFVLTVNGSLLPFFGLWGDRIVCPISQRGMLSAIWGASRVTYLSASRREGYTTRLSARRFLALGWRAATTLVRFARAYPALCEAYRKGYAEMTDRPFWEKLLGVQPPRAAEPAATEAPATVTP